MDVMKKPTQGSAIPVVEKTRSIKDCATGDWNVEFRILQVDGRTTSVLVPAADAESPRALARCLRTKGAHLPREPGARANLISRAIAAEPEEIVYQLANPGWLIIGGETRLFSCGLRLIGKTEGTTKYSPPAFIAGSRAKAFAVRGTLENWQDRVAQKALYSTSLTAILAAAPAAVVLRASGLQNFSVHLSGPSRCGKTTELLAAMSFFGFGEERDLPTWVASAARLLETATAFGDMPFPLNEVGAKRGRRAQSYEGLRDLYAQYAEGSDLERHSAWEKEHGGAARPIHGICIATAEHTIAEYAEMAGEVRDDGELFRAIDVSAIRKGGTTIFDLAPPGLDPRAELQELRKAIAECHGTALEPYIAYLMQLGYAEVRRRTLALIKEFVDHMPEAAHDGVINQMAVHFGLLYAGAILGIESGVLSWTRAHVRSALTRAFRDAIIALRTVDPLAVGLDILKAKLRGTVVERKRGSSFGVKHHAGYWTWIGGKRVCVVHARQFRAWFTSKRQRNLVIGSLAAKSISHRWPDGSLVRCFEFSDPFSGKSPMAGRNRLRKFGARKKALTLPAASREMRLLPKP
jgi:hypothetical protein